MRLAIDTSRYRDLCDGKRDVVERLETVEAIFVPFVVLAELRAGFASGTKGRANERVLHRFLAQPGVEILHGTDATTHSYAGAVPPAACAGHTDPDPRPVDRRDRPGARAGAVLAGRALPGATTAEP